MNSSPSLHRRTFLRTGVATLATPLLAQPSLESHQATGTRVGEVTDQSAIIWTRLTRHSTRNNAGVPFNELKDGKGKGKAKAKSVVPPAHEIEGACPPMSGRVRVRYGLSDDGVGWAETEWAEVTEAQDGIRQFAIKNLKAGSTYHYAVETQGLDGSRHEGFKGQFQTSLAAQEATDMRFCVMTCQGYQDRDHKDGHPIYPAMQALDPKFIVMTGDLVYYDSNPPRATSPALARLHWERMFSLPRLVAAMRSTSSYWLKDDHDTLTNDCWPGMEVGELTFNEGLQIFREQAPLGSESYRTVRWGRDLQVWFTDGRDHRSPNSMPDGPDKTIWGTEQKAWFKRTMKESSATWKVVVSPTPLVGPDRDNKNDNHSNKGFAHEGDELREWLKENVLDHVFLVCGDRHWQYHSVHPTSGVQEFSVGPASNSHAAGTPGEDLRYHKFHRVQGGFLCVELKAEQGRSSIAFQLRDVDGKISYEAKFTRLV